MTKYAVNAMNSKFTTFLRLTYKWAFSTQIFVIFNMVVDVILMVCDKWRHNNQDGNEQEPYTFDQVS